MLECMFVSIICCFFFLDNLIVTTMGGEFVP